ncbi:MAG: polynucleotide adenylyltransferase PcnB [Candidatus Dadabacteria bacterium]|nr:MAG: polynucleotide adenylyltransferase PcnB [Candidatus Dadabacteria bacterium]
MSEKKLQPLKISSKEAQKKLKIAKSPQKLTSLIPPEVIKIIKRLKKHKFTAYIVGGGVRDLLLGKKPKDFDVVTDAKPNKIKRIFSNCRVIGRRFKLVHVYFRGGKIIEVSTFRDESKKLPKEETDPFKPWQIRENVFGNETTDAFRRDLTINALFFDPLEDKIIDYVGGLRDLSEGIVRVIGDPAVRYREDPVRMLRVVRHSARAGFEINQLSWEEILKLKHLIRLCPSARLYEEFKKDLNCGYFSEVFGLLIQSGLLEELLPKFPLKDLNKNYLHQFVTALRKMDWWVMQTENSATTASLSLFAIASKLICISTKGVALSKVENYKQHLRSLFLPIGVPRREREKIEELILAFKSVVLNKKRYKEIRASLRFPLKAFAYALWDPEKEPFLFSKKS